ncbi:MAG TPA: hypothetical protein VM223_18215 [Planctomycetota bacterium]|nr:hypothetical protein [Planctomycetota bacterium]
MQDTRKDAAIVAVAGDTNRGKTVDAVYTFPRAVFIGESTAITKVAASQCGLRIAPERIQPCRTLYQVTEFVRSLVAARDAAREAGQERTLPPLVIDDFTILAKATAAHLQSVGCANNWWREDAAGNLTGGGPFAFWRRFLEGVTELRDLLRWSAIDCYISGHLRAPSTNKQTGTYNPGGLELPSHGSAKDLVHLLCTVVVADVDTARSPWPVSFSHDPGDMRWYTKDRHNMAYASGPANMRALLTEADRARGWTDYTLDYPVGLEWLAEGAELVYRWRLEGDERKGAAAKLRERVTKLSPDPRHTYWAIRDGLDRAEYAVEADKRFLDRW